MKISVNTSKIMGTITIDDEANASEVMDVVVGMMIAEGYHPKSVLGALENSVKQLSNS